MPTRLDKVLSLIFDVPLMVDERTLDIVMGYLQSRLELSGGFIVDGVALNIEEDEEGEPRRSEKPYQIVGRNAIIPVTGELTHRAGFLNAASGMQSYSNIVGMAEQAMEDSKVKQVFFEYDTPGGTAKGAFEGAENLYRLRGRKPMIAIVNEQATSAGYLLASTADRIVMNPSGFVGSIGVISRLVDREGLSEQNGVKTITLKAGEHKDTFSPPFTKDKVERIQANVDRTYGMFVSAVSRYTGLTEEAIRETKGGVIDGKTAVEKGFAHEIASVRELLTTGKEIPFSGSAKPKTNMRMKNMDEFKQLCQSLGVQILEDENETLRNAKERVNELLKVEGDANDLMSVTECDSLDAIAVLLDSMVPQERLEEAVKKSLQMEAEQFVTDLMGPEQGKLTAAKKDWALKRYMRDPEAFKELMADAPRVIPESNGDGAGKPQKTEVDLSSNEDEFKGFTEDEKMHYRAKGYSEEQIAKVEADLKG